ncbi:MAG: LysE family translocator [Sedimenticola sp.]|nr:LysE family translocator [Sedimenticola sp.]
MSVAEYLTFLTIALVATASPGPAVLLAMTNAVTLGLRLTLVAILGNVTGILLLAVLSSIGLGALLQTSESLFLLVRWVGGLYLVYLGIRLWRSGGLTIPADGVPVGRWRRHPLRLFLQAFMVAVSNPKAIAFCTALFPQFVEPGPGMWHQFVLLAFSFGLLSFTFLGAYAVLACRSRDWANGIVGGRRFSRFTGGLFVGFGSLMLVGGR